MFDYKLRFDNEDQANQVLETYKQDVHNVAVVEIGTLYDPIETGETDEEGHPLFTSVPIEGFHVDVRSRNAIDFGKYAIQPKNPRHEIA